MNIGLGGKLSSGKTVIGLSYVIDALKNNKKIISNIELDLQYTHLSNEGFLRYIIKALDNPDLLNKMFFNSCLFLDEISQLLDARKSTSYVNDLVTNFIIMAGKLDCDIIFTYQILESQVDLRLREICDLFGYCIPLDENLNPMFLRTKRIIENQIYILVLYTLNLGTFGNFEYYKLYDPKPFYKLYNTREIVLLNRDLFKKKSF